MQVKNTKINLYKLVGLALVAEALSHVDILDLPVWPMRVVAAVTLLAGLYIIVFDPRNV